MPNFEIQVRAVNPDENGGYFIDRMIVDAATQADAQRIAVEAFGGTNNFRANGSHEVPLSRPDRGGVKSTPSRTNNAPDSRTV